MASASKFVFSATLTGLLAALPTVSAEAGCRRLGFSVNDYGKEGPTKDALALLDKHIETWAAEQGIEKYIVGKKDVSCELFLNMIVFDEHTCTASATVCWGGDKPPSGGGQQAKSKAKSTPAKLAKDDEAAKTAAVPAKIETGTAQAADTSKASDAKPSESTKTQEQEANKVQDQKPAEEAKSGAPNPPPVETGALPLSNRTAESTPAATPPASGPSPERQAAEAAAAAAERAAAAAERAAAAVERAAALLSARAAADAAAAQTSPAAAAQTPSEPKTDSTAPKAATSSMEATVPPIDPAPTKQ